MLHGLVGVVFPCRDVVALHRYDGKRWLVLYPMGLHKQHDRFVSNQSYALSQVLRVIGSKTTLSATCLHCREGGFNQYGLLDVESVVRRKNPIEELGRELIKTMAEKIVGWHDNEYAPANLDHIHVVG